MSKKTSRKKSGAPLPSPENASGRPPKAASAPAAPGPKRSSSPPRELSSGQRWGALVLILAMFLCSCFTTPSLAKALALTIAAAAAVSAVPCFSRLRSRVSLPLLAVAAWVLMNGVSAFYAVSGKLALREFLKIFIGWCLLLLIVTWPKKGPGMGRIAAAMLEGSAALASLVSIDMISTRFLSGAVFALLKNFTTDYMALSFRSVESGIRMISFYENPNIFAGCAALGILLSLGLAVTCTGVWERRFHLACLYITSLAFVLVFSMGASGMILVAFLLLLFFERKSRRGALFVLMGETLLLTLAGVFPIFRTAFTEWDGVEPVPLLCAVLGAVLLCLVDQFAGRRLVQALQDRGRILLAAGAAVFLLLAGYAAAALTLTGPAALDSQGQLTRAAYPKPGTYTLTVEASAPVEVLVRSQNRENAMMHTYVDLYNGPAQGAQFAVPEDSLLVYFSFTAPEAATLDAVRYEGGSGGGSVPLRYLLLPGFIANRLQGLLANENAIQRVVFFADGMKLFRKSPVFGLGLGTFDTSARSVQSFYYETKYTHNHYVETLITTGVVGLVLFVGMLAVCAAAVWKNLRRGEEADPLAPALGAALFFMAGHGAVEVIWSSNFFLLYALGVLGLICLCCGGELPVAQGRKKAANGILAGMGALMAVFCVFLGLNVSAQAKADAGGRDPFRILDECARMDFFEWPDYLLTYVIYAQGIEPEQRWDVYVQAQEYARRLSQVDSNTIPPYLAKYYFSIRQQENAMAMLEKTVDYMPSYSGAWQEVFDILEAHDEDTPEYRGWVEKLYEKFETWNAENMGSVTLSEANLRYLAWCEIGSFS